MNRRGAFYVFEAGAVHSPVTTGGGGLASPHIRVFNCLYKEKGGDLRGRSHRCWSMRERMQARQAEEAAQQS